MSPFRISDIDTPKTAFKRIAEDFEKLTRLRNYEKKLHEQTDLHLTAARVQSAFAFDFLRDFSSEISLRLAAARKYF